jgi:hypothetical protein
MGCTTNTQDTCPFTFEFPLLADLNNINVYLRDTGCEDGRWMELAQDRVQWRALVLTVLKLQFCYQGNGKYWSILYV